MAKKKRIKTAIRAPRCAKCDAIVTWDRVKIAENEPSVYIRERMYYCPECGAIVGVSSWHQFR